MHQSLQAMEDQPVALAGSSRIQADKNVIQYDHVQTRRIVVEKLECC